MLGIDLALFGVVPGTLIWAVQMVWIPFWAAGVINGIGHWWGYRNFACADASRNIVPIAFVVGGEELHNNHHAYRRLGAAVELRPYEFDIGWLYIRALEVLGMARSEQGGAAPASHCAPAGRRWRYAEGGADASLRSAGEVHRFAEAGGRRRADAPEGRFAQPPAGDRPAFTRCRRSAGSGTRAGWAVAGAQPAPVGRSTPCAANWKPCGPVPRPAASNW